MKYKDIKLSIKEVSDQGQFEGYASVFNNEDLGGDIITPGAFSKTISENPTVPILWGHSTKEVIGVNKVMSEDARGLRVTGQLALDVQRAKEAHSLMKMGAVKGLSIGYDPIVVDYSRMEKDNVRILREVKLWEYSVTPFPMNPEAQVTTVKSIEQFDQLLNQLIAFKSPACRCGCEDCKAGKHDRWMCGDSGCEIGQQKTALIEQAIEKLSALRAAQAPGAAKQDEIAPEIIHAASSRITGIEKLLRGEI